VTQVIELRNVTKSYLSTDVKTTALRDISLGIAEGEFVAVSGPSGCGKSTLMNMVGLLDFPDSGTVTAFGTTLQEHDEARLTALRRGNVGFIFQAFNLIEELTVEQNVAMPLDYVGGSKQDRHRRAAELLEEVGLTARATHRPSQLSGGQQQRVAIARALAASPALIVADEPTGNLDSRNSVAIMELLGGLAGRGTAIIIVTHSPDLAAMAGREIMMQDGMIVGER